MRGVYTAALAATMLEAGLAFPWVGGISAGGSHATNFVARDIWRTRAAFVDVAADKQFAGWGSFLRGKGYFNAEYLYEHTTGPDESLPYNWENFATSDTQVRIGAYNCETGEERYWGREDLPTMEHLLRRTRASASMPGLMPFVEIDGVPYCDGALGPTGGFAIDAAQADGYEKFVVVMTRERGYRKPLASHEWAYRSIFRRHPAVAQGILDRPTNYNRTLDELLELESQARIPVFPGSHAGVQWGTQPGPTRLGLCVGPRTGPARPARAAGVPGSLEPPA